MGVGGNQFMFREDFGSRGERPIPKPSLFDRFKLWRSGSDSASVDANGEAPASATSTDSKPTSATPQFKTSKELRRERLKPLHRDQLDTQFGSNFRDEFSSRLDEIVQASPIHHSPPASLGAGKPAADAVYVPQTTKPAEGQHLSTQGLSQVSSGLDELARLLETIHERIAETSQRGGETQELIAKLPEVVQSLPAIGRGQLSILSGMASEQRAIGTNLAERIDQQGERTHDLVGAIESVQERTSEVVRSVDELRDVLATLPGSLQAQAEILELTRSHLASLQAIGSAESARLLEELQESGTQSLTSHRRLETALAVGLGRHEEILVEGFVNQTIALEGVRTAVEGLATSLDASARRTAEVLQASVTRSSESLEAGMRKAVEAMPQPAAADPERLADIIIPDFKPSWRGYSLVAGAAAFLVLVGVGITTLVGDQSGAELADKTGQMLATLEQERTLLKEQMAAMQTSMRENMGNAEAERADYMARMANMMELNEKLVGIHGQLKNDKEMLEQRVKRLAGENLAMRASAGLASEDKKAKPERE